MALGSVELKEVSLVRNGNTLLNALNWKVQPGEHWAVIGRNGSGKTLTLRIVSGYLWPTSGSVTVLGRKFGTFDLRTLRSQIGWVSQSIQFEFQRGHKTRDVVLSGAFGSVGLHESPTEVQRERAEHLIKELEIEQITERSFHLLSYGEQKRVLIARALMAEPKLLVLDEPCTGLDLKSREEFLLRIQSLANDPNGPSLLYVTHHIEEVMPFITHALVLKGGTCLAKGKKTDTLINKTLSEAFDMPVEIDEQSERFWLRVLRRSSDA